MPCGKEREGGKSRRKSERQELFLSAVLPVQVFLIMI
jgi:hypothetical protein